MLDQNRANVVLVKKNIDGVTQNEVSLFGAKFSVWNTAGTKCVICLVTFEYYVSKIEVI